MSSDNSDQLTKVASNWPMAVVVCVFIAGIVAVVYVVADMIKSLGC